MKGEKDITRWPWNRSALLEATEALHDANDGDLMRRLLRTILQVVIDAEAASHIGTTRTATATEASGHGRVSRRDLGVLRHPASLAECEVC